MEEKKKKLTGQQGELMRALDINVDDLMANDQGTISEDQQNSVLERQSYQWKPLNMTSTVMLGLAVFFTTLGIVGAESAAPSYTVSFVLLVVSLWFKGLGFRLYRQLKTELENNAIQTIQGIAVVDLRSSQLEINDLKLNVSADALKRIQHLQPYIIHYLPKSKIILSMEHISEDDNIRDDDMRQEQWLSEHEQSSTSSKRLSS